MAFRQLHGSLELPALKSSTSDSKASAEAEKMVGKVSMLFEFEEVRMSKSKAKKHSLFVGHSRFSGEVHVCLAWL